MRALAVRITEEALLGPHKHISVGGTALDASRLGGVLLTHRGGFKSFPILVETSCHTLRRSIGHMVSAYATMNY